MFEKRRQDAALRILLGPPLGGKDFLHHPCNQIQQVADILQAADIRELELDVELLLDGRQQVDLLQAVPVLDVIGAGAAGDLQGVVVKIIAEKYPVPRSEFPVRS